MLVVLGAGEAPAEDAGDEPPLSGRDIYARVIANRFESFEQDSTLASGDRVGRIQKTRIHMRFMDFRDVEDRSERGVLSKTLVTYTHPFDLRHSAYLVIQNEDRASDQFLYLPTRRQTVRVNLRSEAVFGTDFSFEDVIPRELGSATYRRLDDDRVDDTAVFVVEATPLAHIESEYSKFVFYVEPERYVPLRTRYWDTAGVETKELRAPRDGIRQFEEIHVPTRLEMRHLLLDSSTTLEITKLVPNPSLPASAFEVRRLETH